MADLSGVLGQVPFLAGWKGTDQLRQQEQAGQLAQAQNLMGILSAAQAQQQKQVALQRDRDAQAALGTLGPNATTADMLKVLRPHVAPEKLIPLLQGEENRRLTVDAQKEMHGERLKSQAAKLDFEYEQLKQKATTEKAKLLLDEWYKRNKISIDEAGLRLTGAKVYDQTGVQVPLGLPPAGLSGQPPVPQTGGVAPIGTFQPSSFTGSTPPMRTPTASPEGFPRRGPTDGLTQQVQIIQNEIADEMALAEQYKDNPQQRDVHLRNAQSLQSELSKIGPAPAAPNNLDARDYLARTSVSGATPTAAPAQAPGASPKAEQPVPDWILRLPPKERREQEAKWRLSLTSPAAVRDARKQETEEKKEDLRLRYQDTKATNVIGKVDDALKKIGYFTTGLTGAALKYVAGTDAYQLDKDIDTIKANIGFQELQAMREASPTGGALGQVAVRELDFLQAVLGSLDVGQRGPELAKNLKAVKTHYENWKKVMQESTKRGPKVGDVVDGYRFKGGDAGVQANWEKQ